MITRDLFNENYNGEYDDEAGMAKTNLVTIARAAQGLLDTIDDQENLPEWVQEKIAKVQGMMVTAWDYLESQEAQGIDPKITDEDADPNSGYAQLLKKRAELAARKKLQGVAESDKIGNMDADAYDSAMARLKQLAGSGPMKTVYDPNTRRYKNVPTAVQPAQQPRKK